MVVTAGGPTVARYRARLPPKLDLISDRDGLALSPDTRDSVTNTPEGETRLPRVLVAEDDASIRRLLATTLRRRRLDIDLAQDGVEALEALQRQQWDVLLMDLMMPRVNGWEVIRWLNENPERKPNSVIVLSAADREALREVDPSVVNAIIFKPFNVVQVGAYVSNAAQHDGPDRRRRRLVTSL